MFSDGAKEATEEIINCFFAFPFRSQRPERLVNFLTAKLAMDRKGAPQRNAFTPIILIYFSSALPLPSVRSPAPCYIISKYLLFSQSVTTRQNCLHSHSRVAVKCSTNSTPNSSLAIGDPFIARLAIERLEGRTPCTVSR